MLYANFWKMNCIIYLLNDDSERSRWEKFLFCLLNAYFISKNNHSFKKEINQTLAPKWGDTVFLTSFWKSASQYQINMPVLVFEFIIWSRDFKRICLDNSIKSRKGKECKQWLLRSTTLKRIQFLRTHYF